MDGWVWLKKNVNQVRFLALLKRNKFCSILITEYTCNNVYKRGKYK